MIKISLVVPIYNSDRYLNDCLESISNQTFSNLEIILVNDGSSDESLNICKKFKKIDPRVTIITTKNKGVSSARNTGLATSKGEYVGFIDSDDIIQTAMISRLVDLIIKYESDVVSCDLVFNANEINKLNDNNRVENFNGSDVIMNNFLTTQVGGISVCNKLFKHSVINNLRFNESIMHNEDKLFLFEVYKKCKRYTHTNYPGYIYPKRIGSASNQPFSKSFFDVVLVAERIEQEILNGDYTKKIKYFVKQSTVLSLLNLYRIMTSSDNLKDYSKEYNKIREKMLSYEVGNFEFINKKRNLELKLLRISPLLYKIITKIYKNLFMEKSR